MSTVIDESVCDDEDNFIKMIHGYGESDDSHSNVDGDI